ncbi:ABC transporter permease subunit [Nonomuraea candida]|uniref:ABC transporter permease subunit n=1 Tax=Nonomuraea candida TaxID=359159 RepID=UPI0005B9CDD3|nr:ABC transporter permease subunit [Nonomuraea candida]
MSTDTPATTPIPAAAADTPAARGRISFGTLLRVETRKLVDTRTSLILTAALGALTLAFVVGRGLVMGVADLFTLAGTAALALGTLLPVLGILSVTGEWSHRTALTTFTLEPRRGRVLAAKCLPVLAMAVAGCLLALLVAVPMTAASAAVAGVEATWRLEPALVLGWIATLVVTTAEGLALGLLCLNAPAAIVIYLVAPMVWGFARSLGPVGETLAEWLDLNVATNALMDGALTGETVPRLVTAVVAWIVVPMAVGVLRVLRKDVH